MIRYWPLLLLLASPLSQAEDIQPWSHAVIQKTLEREEDNLWEDAAEFDKSLLLSGEVRNDPALNAYLQKIMDRLYPEFDGSIRVHVLNSNTLNAFALPNGSVYFNTGLLARLQSEAQVATVLAHEGAHFVYRHSFQQASQTQNAAAVALIAGMAGYPLLGNIVALTSMSGYSREHESEADAIGLKRLVAAGYSAQEAPKTFEHLIAEIKALDIDEPFFFASHPKLQDRVDSLNAMLKDMPTGGEIGLKPYLLAIRDIRLFTLQEDLEAYRYKQLILVLSDPARRREYPPEASYYLGEAYRLRDEKGDQEKAEHELTLCLELSPDFAPAYKAMGMLEYRRAHKPQATILFRRYLELAPKAQDRAYFEAYVKEIGT